MFNKNRIPKVKTHHYITNKKEPADNPSRDSLANNETVLIENSPFMRAKFRDIATRIRIIRIHGTKEKI